MCHAFKNICVHISFVTAACIFSHVFHTFRENVLFYSAFSRFLMNTCCHLGSFFSNCFSILCCASLF